MMNITPESEPGFWKGAAITGIEPRLVELQDREKYLSNPNWVIPTLWGNGADIIVKFSLEETTWNLLLENQRLRAENETLRQQIARLESENSELWREKVIRESGFILVDDVIAERMRDPDFKEAWEEQQRQREQELKQRLDQGKISKIKYYRLLRKVDQATLAERTGIKQPNISRCEQVGHRPSWETLERIARALNIEKDKLL